MIPTVPSPPCAPSLTAAPPLPPCQYEQAADAELAWVAETKRKLMALGPIRLEQDQTTAQLQVQKVCAHSSLPEGLGGVGSKEGWSSLGALVLGVCEEEKKKTKERIALNPPSVGLPEEKASCLFAGAWWVLWFGLPWESCSLGSLPLCRALTGAGSRKGLEKMNILINEGGFHLLFCSLFPCSEGLHRSLPAARRGTKRCWRGWGFCFFPLYIFGMSSCLKERAL